MEYIANNLYVVVGIVVLGAGLGIAAVNWFFDHILS